MPTEVEGRLCPYASTVLTRYKPVTANAVCCLGGATLINTVDKIYSVHACDVHQVHPHMLLSVSIATVLNQCGSATEWNNL